MIPTLHSQKVKSTDFVGTALKIVNKIRHHIASEKLIKNEKNHFHY